MKSVRLVSAKIEQSDLIKLMMQRYLGEFAKFTEVEVDKDGQFAYRYLDHYWQSSDRHPYLVFTLEHLAGFCLVRDDQDPVQGLKYKELAELFIEKPYRRQGMGEVVLNQLLNLHPGVWRISVLKANQVGCAFWESVLKSVAGITKEHPSGTDPSNHKTRPEHVYWLKSD